MAKRIDAAPGVSRLVLLDTHAIIHRAYHALAAAELKAPDGSPTGALYGLVSMLLRIVEDLKPDYLVACRDLPGKTHRHEMFDGYKAQRAQLEPDLISQIQRAPSIFEAFGVPMYSMPGFEADDMLGMIVKQISIRSDIDTVIASGDLDMLQMVQGRHVQVYTLRTGLNDTIMYDEDRVRERYGFGPEHITDYKALRGDPSDNIPGIKGIGEKTATDLIMQFGSIEEMYASLEKNEDAFAKKVKPRIVGLLKEGKPDAHFSKELATIRGDAPITFALPKTHWHLVDHSATVAALCDDLGFKSLKNRVNDFIRDKEDFPTGPESVTTPMEFEVAPPEAAALEETSVALWLLRSEYTTPSLDDVLGYGDTRDFGLAREKIFTDLRSTGRLEEVFEKIERPLIPIMHRMNADGIALDVSYLKDLAEEYNAELSKIAARIYAHAGHEFNISSPKQLGVVLYDELKIVAERQKKTATGARTTREEELLKLSDQHEIIGDVLSYRELQKLLSTYVEKMPALLHEDGRLHPTFLQAGSATGRMASENPGVQNIPIKSDYGRRIRAGFVAEKGNALVALDYSQIELRIAAGLSGDEKLIGVFKDGGDVHTAVAAQVFNVPPEHVDKEMRRRAKVINFGILYGMGVNSLRMNLGANISREESSRFLSDYFQNFSGLSSWIERTKTDAARTGYTETLYGRRRYFPGFKSPLPQMRAQAERMATNAPIQGTQADIIKLAMVEADRIIEEKKWRDQVRLVMQVHDELVYEIDEKIAVEVAQEIRRVMESAVPSERLGGVPILAEAAIGKNWGDMKKLAR